MVVVKDIAQCIEEFAPLSFQEVWDNCGLLVGSPQQSVNKVLLTIDVTEDVVDEAIEHKIQLIISHHPVILSGIKQLTGNTAIQRAIMKAIKHNISIYAAHTNMDVTHGGVSYRMAGKLGLSNVRVLSPQGSGLCKLVTFVPYQYLNAVRDAVFAAGAGHIGNYDYCGYCGKGEGTFRALEGSNPFVGQHDKVHIEPEMRFETIFPSHLRKKVITALLANHPYEEPAFDIYNLQNDDQGVGLGVVGVLPAPVSEERFLMLLKEIFRIPVLRHTNYRECTIQTVALCGGSGSSLLQQALSFKADVFVTADFKYHQFIEAENNILIADIGHFESEQFTKEIFSEILERHFPDLIIHHSKVKTNPVNFL